MGKFSTVLCISISLLVFSSGMASARAQVAETNRLRVTAKVQQNIQEREQKLMLIQEKLENKVASREARLNAIRQNLIKKYFLQMSERLEATIERLETLIKRIETRLAAVDSETDKDLSKIQADIDKAKTLLTDSKDLLNSANEMLETVLTSSDPKSSFEVVRQNITDIKNNLKEVHRLLVKVIGDLSGLRVGVYKISPTVTPSSN